MPLDLNKKIDNSSKHTVKISNTLLFKQYLFLLLDKIFKIKKSTNKFGRNEKLSQLKAYYFGEKF